MPSRGGTEPASNSGPPLRPEGLAKKEQRSFLTSVRLSDQKAWPRKGPCLRPGIHRTSAYSSSPTSAVGADWDQPTKDARSIRTRKRMKQVRQGTQVNRNTEDCTLHTCRIVTDRTCQEGALQPSRQARIQAVLWAPTFALQCCGRYQLPYQTNMVRLPHVPLGINSVVGAGIYHTRRTW